jgi:tetratricopeptide (TPR) repeat protein
MLGCWRSNCLIIDDTFKCVHEKKEVEVLCMLSMKKRPRMAIVILCLLSMMYSVWGAEEEKDAFSFRYDFELKEDRTCHITIVETITFYEHYIGNPKFLTEYEADQYDFDDPSSGGGFFGSFGGSGTGPGSGGQRSQAGSGKYPLIEYLHYMELTEYSPHNFKATDSRTGERLTVTERTYGKYRDFIIDIKNYIGAPKKGDTYILLIEYDTENRAELLGTGKYAFSFYREGPGEGGSYEYSISVMLPPYYEYEKSNISTPSSVYQSSACAKIRYQGEHSGDEVYELRLEYHYPVSVFVEEGISLLEEGDYSGAQGKLEEARRRYQNLGKHSELAEVNVLISQCGEVEQINQLYESAKMQFANKEFASARQQFEDLLSYHSHAMEDDMIRECSYYVEICEKFQRAQELEQQAGIDVQGKRWSSAISSLQEAKTIYEGLGEDDKVSWIEGRIEEIQKNSKEETMQSQLNIFVVGSAILIGGIVFAFFGYNKLKNPGPAKTLDVGSLLENPDVPDEVKKFLEEKTGWRKVSTGDLQEKNRDVIEKLQQGKETLEKMYKDGLISEREFRISIEEIEGKIENLRNN